MIRIRLEINWRSYIFNTDASRYYQVENPDPVLSGSNGIWKFPNLLADYPPADTLFETIEGFHDTKANLRFLKSR